MTLLELCDPLLQYVCRLNRMARKGGSEEYAQVRAEVEDLFKAMRLQAQQDHSLTEQYEKVELPLVYFVDHMISESRLGCAGEWNHKRLAFERDRLSGDEEFFDLLDETLKEGSAASRERLAIFYTCMGLGFGGLYAGDYDMLRKKMNECWAQLPSRSEASDMMRLTPDAYRADSRILWRGPGKMLLGIGIVLVALVLVLVVANVAAFKDAVKGLDGALNQIVQKGPAR